jgi:hypothetical protein
METMMGKSTIILLGLTAAAAMFAGPASALTCYTILDKGDTVIYRGYEPPVDMSAAGATARETMRRQGQYMMISYVDECLLVGGSRWMSASQTGTYAPATVDEIVSGLRPFASGAPSGTPTSVGGASRTPAAPRAAPAARSSSSGRGY